MDQRGITLADWFYGNGLAEGRELLQWPEREEMEPVNPLALNRGRLIWNLIEPRKGTELYGYLKPRISKDGISIKDIGLMYRREF